jgi:hypothetical protein
MYKSHKKCEKIKQRDFHKSQQFYIIDSNNSGKDKVSNKEFKRMAIRKINKIKDDKNKHLNKLKENTKTKTS